MASARARDLDELGVMLMSLIRGMENTTAWLGTDNLAQYGLESGSTEGTDT